MSKHDALPVVALYLPQFYETSYNNYWWGEGYTDWVACREAKPLFEGHRQPRVPYDSNYYDLSKVDNLIKQADMARSYGIDGFAVYHYYSCGKKLLHKPLELIRDNKTIDITYFLFWANEHWRKAWFGHDESIIWRQEYGTKTHWKQQYTYCSSFFKDSRYIKIDNRPVYAIYKAWDIDDIDEFIELWNTWAMEDGFSGIYFVKALGRKDKERLGSFSAIATREPNYTFAFEESLFEKILRVSSSSIISILNKKILFAIGKGIVMKKIDYDKIWQRILRRSYNQYPTLVGAFVDWDNSPRKSYNSTIMTGVEVDKFRKYFHCLYHKAKEQSSPMILINAWNEWGEGAYLEPDQITKYGYLEAIKDVVNGGID